MNTNAVLCAIILENNEILSVALSKDDYQSIIIDEVKLIYELQDSSEIQISYNQSLSYFYLLINETRDSREESFIQQICLCAEDNCNLNLNKCLNATRSLIPSNNSQSKTYLSSFVFFLSFFSSIF
ncbi:hypothetical protein I4U23_015011 [Adineta vaga]|nr:hypothetical protein I4U23_015011 [Adineta vaga]